MNATAPVETARAAAGDYLLTNYRDPWLWIRESRRDLIDQLCSWTTQECAQFWIAFFAQVRFLRAMEAM